MRAQRVMATNYTLDEAKFFMTCVPSVFEFAEFSTPVVGIVPHRAGIASRTADSTQKNESGVDLFPESGISGINRG